jgi:hypothetical protein
VGDNAVPPGGKPRTPYDDNDGHKEEQDLSPRMSLLLHGVR